MSDEILDKFGDHGAETSRRYEFQKHYAAHWCIEMLSDTSITEVLCEYGEDVVINRRCIYELHQVKTKQESVDDWKWEDLVDPVGKSFAMVPYFGNVSKCCFVSNEGATGLLLELKQVIGKNPSDWTREDTKFFEAFCGNHLPKVLRAMQRIDTGNSDSLADVKDRFHLLEIQTDFHHMDHIQDTNVRRLRKVLEAMAESVGLAYSYEEMSETYEHLIGVIAKATIGQTRDEKTVLKKDVLHCVRLPLRRRSLYKIPSQAEIGEMPGGTRLERKLRSGGFTPHFVQDASELRAAVMVEERKWNFGHMPQVMEDVRARAKHLCVDAYDKVCVANPGKRQVGRDVLEEVKVYLPRLIKHYSDHAFVDDYFLTGIIWDLTAQCKTTWSQGSIR